MISETALEPPKATGESTQSEIFLRLIGLFEPAMWRLVGSYFEHDADRSDLFQEIAVALWQAIPTFRGDSSERTWFYRIAHNVAITSSAKLRRRNRTEDPITDELDPPSGSYTPEQETLRSEQLRLLKNCIRELPLKDRQIILLHLEGLSHAEIEAVTGYSGLAIATRLTRIRTRLREKIIALRRPVHE